MVPYLQERGELEVPVPPLGVAHPDLLAALYLDRAEREVVGQLDHQLHAALVKRVNGHNLADGGTDANLKRTGRHKTTRE